MGKLKLPEGVDVDALGLPEDTDATSSPYGALGDEGKAPPSARDVERAYTAFGESPEAQETYDAYIAAGVPKAIVKAAKSRGLAANRAAQSKARETESINDFTSRQTAFINNLKSGDVDRAERDLERMKAILQTLPVRGRYEDDVQAAQEDLVAEKVADEKVRQYETMIDEGKPGEALAVIEKEVRNYPNRKQRDAIERKIEVRQTRERAAEKEAARVNRQKVEDTQEREKTTRAAVVTALKMKDVPSAREAIAQAASEIRPEFADFLSKQVDSVEVLQGQKAEADLRADQERRNFAIQTKMASIEQWSAGKPPGTGELASLETRMAYDDPTLTQEDQNRALRLRSAHQMMYPMTASKEGKAMADKLTQLAQTQSSAGVLGLPHEPGRSRDADEIQQMVEAAADVYGVPKTQPSMQGQAPGQTVYHDYAGALGLSAQTTLGAPRSLASLRLANAQMLGMAPIPNAMEGAPTAGLFKTDTWKMGAVAPGSDVSSRPRALYGGGGSMGTRQRGQSGPPRMQMQAPPQIQVPSIDFSPQFGMPQAITPGMGQSLYGQPPDMWPSGNPGYEQEWETTAPPLPKAPVIGGSGGSRGMGGMRM